MEYDIQFSCCSCKITEIEGNTSWENRNKKKTYVWQHGTRFQKKVSRRH